VKHRDVLVETAQTSSYKFRLGALVEFEGRVVGTGFNRLEPNGWIHTLNAQCGTLKNSTHAEIDAILNTPEDLRDGAVLYVLRILKNGQLALAKPCEICLAAAESVGIRRIVYTTNDEVPGVIEVGA